MIIFTGFPDPTVKCGELHGPLVYSDGEVARWESYFAGLHGISEIVGSNHRTSFLIECKVWLNHEDFQDPGGPPAVSNYERLLRQWQGKHGDLEERWVNPTDTLANYSNHCTFMGFQRMPFNGQEFAGMIEANGCGVAGWVIQGLLRWRCLKEPDV